MNKNIVNVDFGKLSDKELKECLKEEEILLEEELKRMKKRNQDISKVKMSRRSEYANIELAKKGDEKAFKRLLNAQMFLIKIFASKYFRKNGILEFNDLIQEGEIGLIKAISKFDYNKGVQFGTYASWRIRQSISTFVNNCDRAIRLPNYLKDITNKIRRFSGEYFSTNGKKATNYQIANGLNMTEKKVRDAKEAYEKQNTIVSLDKPIGDDESEGGTYNDIVGDEKSLHFTEELNNQMIVKEITDIMEKHLDDRERYVLMNRFGLSIDGFDQKKKTVILKNIGDHLNLTKERVRQIGNDAKNKIKHFLKLKGIDVSSVSVR